MKTLDYIGDKLAELQAAADAESHPAVKAEYLASLTLLKAQRDEAVALSTTSEGITAMLAEEFSLALEDPLSLTESLVFLHHL